MRDIYKSDEYFLNILEQVEEGIQNQQLIKSKQKIAEPMKSYFDKLIITTYFNKFSLSYSIGKSYLDLKNQFSILIEVFIENWHTEIATYSKNDVNYYFEYDYMLKIISFLCLFDAEVKYFHKINELILKDGVNDYILNYLLSFKIRSYIGNRIDSGVRNEKFSNYLQAIDSKNEFESINHLKKYLSLDWYKIRKKDAMYNSHISDGKIYFGYWAYEAAALVKVNQLNDASLKGIKYYPEDLVIKN